MYKITDRQGFSYYMTDSNIDNKFSRDLSGLVAMMRYMTDSRNWVMCYQDTLLRDKVVIRADEIYLIQEVKKP